MEENKQAITEVVEPVINYTIAYLQNEFGITVKNGDYKIECPKKLELKYITAIIGTGGAINVIFSISYDKQLISYLTKKILLEEVSEDEELELQECTACETTNIILGNAISHMPNISETINITPPVAIKEAKNIAKQKHAIICAVELDTDHGKMSINYVSPKELFNLKLEYKE